MSIKEFIDAAYRLIALADDVEATQPGSADFEAWREPIAALRSLLQTHASEQAEYEVSATRWTRISLRTLLDSIGVLDAVGSSELAIEADGFSALEVQTRLDRLMLDACVDSLVSCLGALFHFPSAHHDTSSNGCEPAESRWSGIRLEGHRVLLFGERKSPPSLPVDPALLATVEQHGGTADWQQVGSCWRLSVSLPLASSSTRPRSDSVGRARTVLVVDDNPDIRFQTRQAISHSYRVIEARDGSEALERIGKVIPDLVLVDIQMPRMDGFEFVRQLRSRPETAIIPVVFLTSHGSAEYKIRAFDAGGDQFIQKPFVSDVLAAQIDRQFRSSQHLIDQLKQTPVESAGQISSARRVPLIDRVKALIRSNIDDVDYDVDRLASDLGVSRTALYQKLKKADQDSPADLIRNFRLENAAQLLADGEASATEVSYAVGFKRLSAFSRAFKDKFGVTPTEYRKQQIELSGVNSKE